MCFLLLFACIRFDFQYQLLLGSLFMWNLMTDCSVTLSPYLAPIRFEHHWLMNWYSHFPAVVSHSTVTKDSGINRQERLKLFFAFFLISSVKGSPLVDYKIILNLRGPCEFNHGGRSPRFGNDHPTYLRLGHYSAGTRALFSRGSEAH